MGRQKKRYWFNENWHGQRLEFSDLWAARRAAKSEYGITVTIYDTKNKIVEFAKASGHTPA